MPWEIVPLRMMKLALSAEHPIANGRDRALYMAQLKRVLENYVMLILSLEGCEEDARRYTKMDVGSEPDDDAADCCEGRRKGVYRWRRSSTS